MDTKEKVLKAREILSRAEYEYTTVEGREFFGEDITSIPNVWIGNKGTYGFVVKYDNKDIAWSVDDRDTDEWRVDIVEQTSGNNHMAIACKCVKWVCEELQLNHMIRYES